MVIHPPLDGAGNVLSTFKTVCLRLVDVIQVLLDSMGFLPIVNESRI